MSENNAVELMEIDDSLEERDSGGAKTGRQICDRRQSDLTAKGDRAGKRQPIGQLSDKFGVVGTLAVARLMVEMDNMQRQIGSASQQKEQSNAVGSAADADGPVSRRNPPHRCQ